MGMTVGQHYGYKSRWSYLKLFALSLTAAKEQKSSNGTTFFLKARQLWPTH
jgi:hypothetical protein